ncbi:MAG TPA: hypothetical protein VJM75_00920, partial [Acidimicrobiales bacterium]|nr:hypothetical protein [Acidimicrobiales bacterium]
ADAILDERAKARYRHRLAELDDRQNVTPDDWDLGSVIMRASDTMRAAIVATLDCHRQLDE